MTTLPDDADISDSVPSGVDQSVELDLEEE
jgi:hypothetical protein